MAEQITETEASGESTPGAELLYKFIQGSLDIKGTLISGITINGSASLGNLHELQKGVIQNIQEQFISTKVDLVKQKLDPKKHQDKSR